MAATRMPTRLAIAIPTFNRARMLDAILRELVPVAEAQGVPLFLSDNGSTDATPEVCARWAARHPLLRVRRHATTLPAIESVMSALAMSDAEYTWLCGDDDYITPAGLGAVRALLDAGSPSAIAVAWLEVPPGRPTDLDAPLGPQLAPLFAQAPSGRREYHDAAEFFRVKVYDLPVPSVIYRTAETLATDYARYHPTLHSHLGALYDALAAEQEKRGRVDVIELLDPCTVSLTAMGRRGKDDWKHISFEDLAIRAFPLWFELLPQLYQPHVPAGLARHRHIFRAAFE